ncbi:MAG: hypothetical protein R6U96_19285 [Promethearchaeia archaeon]
MPGEQQNRRKCPYCGNPLEHPYWAHIQAEHPEEYQKKETWVQLYNDYKSMGMQKAMSLKVISELFNTKPAEIESFLKNKDIL